MPSTLKGTGTRGVRPDKTEPLLERGLAGTVKWYDAKKGMGWIIASDLREIYVHHSGLATKAFGPLHEGAAVTFDIVQGERGPKCTNVVLADGHKAGR